MPYHEFTISIPVAFKDALVHAFAEAGSLGSIETKDGLIAYFPDSCDPATVVNELSVRKALLDGSGTTGTITFAHTLIPEQDWNESWKKDFKPVDAGNRFTVIPPWEQPQPGRINLVIDPAMAFGTGHHETTSSCLALMEKYSADCGSKSFLDLGTGTGILAIAAAKLGYHRIAGIDTDPLAVDAGLLNIAINRTPNVDIRPGTLSEGEPSYDVIAANLISGVLVQLASAIAAHLNPGGVGILSGILTGQDDEVVEAMEQAGLALVERHPDGKWTSLVMKRHSAA